MTYLALVFSHYINGVSLRHDEISHSMFPAYPINSITNGVHAVTWTAPAFQDLYDRHIPEWRGDNLYLRYAISIPLDEIQQAHAEAKRELLAEVKRRTGVRLDPAAMTLGFARRAADVQAGGPAALRPGPPEEDSAARLAPFRSSTGVRAIPGMKAARP